LLFLFLIGNRYFH